MNIFFTPMLAVILLFCSCTQATKDTPKTSNTISIAKDDDKATIVEKATRVVPTDNQYAALNREFIAFIHFGPNTFTRMEWGTGKEDPKIFDLKTLDTDQWCDAMKSAGMKMVILTVKHHDGFVLWQSRYTKHGIMSSNFKDGKGDVLKDLSASCKKYGLKLGVYLSPADLYQIENKEGLYGNLSKYTKRTIPRKVAGRPFANKTTFEFMVDDYNEYFLNQLFELLTEYGPVHEVWFDGAHPKRKGGQTYNYAAWKKLIRTLAPKAVIFGKEDIRWCGNESGKTRDTEWNVIPFLDDPNKMNGFVDLTNDDIGSRSKLYKAKYLHYQPAETNTSIRQGWFYRDDDKQQVRSADDVFDIYERSVGGNSIFLLNIPPNRSGRFSSRDVKALQEVGKRIRNTYNNNLLKGASGPKNVLDNDTESYTLLNDTNAIEISTKKPITINRLVLQEAIKSHGERVERHALDAWINNRWTEVTRATNIGHKRILRFKNTTSNKFRIRILSSRATPTISNIAAYYYETRPPQLSLSRVLDGTLKITPKKDLFSWKPHGENASKNLNTNYEVHYTTDGSTPTKQSKLYKKGVKINNQEVKAIAITPNAVGSVASYTFGFLKTNWRLAKTDSAAKNHSGQLAFDEDPNSFWLSNPTGASHTLSVDLGATETMSGFAYTPPNKRSDGMIESGTIKISSDGKRWKTLETFSFGNLINDPVRRIHHFKKPVRTRFVKIISKTIAGNQKRAAIAELDFFK